MKLCTKSPGKRTSRSGTGARGTWQPMILTYFTSSSPSKFSWHSFFNLARSKCSFYWCYIFSLMIFFTKNINTEGKTCYSKAIGEQRYSQKTPILESFFDKVPDLHLWTLLKRDSSIGLFLWIFKIFRSAFFIEHFRWLLLTVAHNCHGKKNKTTAI